MIDRKIDRGEKYQVVINTRQNKINEVIGVASRWLFYFVWPGKSLRGSP